MVVTSNSIGFNRTGGWHEEQIFENDLAPPPLWPKQDMLLGPLKSYKSGDKMSLKW